jgi:FAD/FMN-containing dehydrogenase
MRSAVYDPVDNTLQVQGGARLGDIDHETYPFGRAVPVGVVSETGIGGLALHGGMGWLMRRYGLTVDNLVEADLVSSNGELLRASPDSHPDLFWALKGGGGNFGVVTSFRFRTRPVERTVWFVTVMYPLEQSVKVLRFWRDYMTGAPEDLASIATFWTVPDDPAVDPGPRGKPTLIILACCSGPADQGEKAVEPLRHIGTPIADLSEPMPFVEAQKALDADYPDGRLYYWKSMYLKGIDDAMIEALTERAARRPSLLTSLDIWALGGAYGGVDADTTPFVYRKAPFIFNIESNWEEPERSEENVAWSRELFKDMERYSTGGVYLNFPGMVEEGAGQMKAAYGRNHDRLLDIKRRYDPDNLFRGNLVV